MTTSASAPQADNRPSNRRTLAWSRRKAATSSPDLSTPGNPTTSESPATYRTANNTAAAAATYRPGPALSCFIRRPAARSAGGVHDQHVDLGFAGDTPGDRENPPDERGSRIQSHIVDDQEIGADLFGEFHQRV